MPVYKIIIDGKTYRVNSPEELTDAQAYLAARQEHERPQPVDTSEPDTYWGGVRKGWDEGSRAGLQGFVRGVVPGAVNAIAGMPKALVGAGVAAIKGAGNLVTDPEKTLTDAYQAIRGIPGSIGTAADDFAKHTAIDPESGGRAIGELTGGTMAGIGASAAVPLLPKPLMRGVGDTMEQMGVKGSWPIKMVGAHQIASGNPMGVLTMMAPAQLAKGGRALRLAGTEAGAAGATLEGQYLKLHQDIQRGRLTDVPSRIAAFEDDLDQRMASAKLPEQVAEVKQQELQLNKMKTAAEKAMAPPKPDQEAIRLDRQREKELLDVRDAAEKAHSDAAKKARDAAEEAQAEALKVQKAKEAKEGLVAQPPSYTETVTGTTPEGVKHSTTTKYVPEDAAGAGDDSLEAALAKAGVGPGRAGSRPRVVEPTAPGGGDGVTRPLGEVVDDAYRNNPNRLLAPIRSVGDAVSAPNGVVPPPPVLDPAAQMLREQPVRPKLNLPKSDANLLNDLVEKALEEGYQGDPKALAEHLYDKVTQVKDAYDEAGTGATPQNLLRAVAKGGGLSIAKETGLKAELEHLKSFRDAGRRTINDVSGVFDEQGGLPADSIVEYLGQDPAFSDIKTPNDLLKRLQDAATAGPDADLAEHLKTVGVEYGKPWWKKVGAPPVEDDMSFDPATLAGSMSAAADPRAAANAAMQREAAAAPPAFADPSAVQSGHALEQSLLGKTVEGTPLADALAPAETPVLPKSRSRSNAVNKGGMTANDLQAVKQFLLENPDATAEDISNHVVAQRGLRQATYRTNAGLDKGMQSALDREPE